MRQSERFLRQLGYRLREARLASGMTQAQLSSLCEVSTGYLAQIEHGRANPSVMALARLYEAVGESSDLLLLPPVTPQERRRGIRRP